MFPAPLRWGGWYLREELSSNALLHLTPIPGTPLVDTNQDYEQDTNSAGVFGNFSWDFADGFRLDAGARFNWERKDFQMIAVDRPTGPCDPDGTMPGVPPCPTAKPAFVDEEWSAPTGGIGVTYFLTDAVSAYAKYTRGWKAGHIQGNSVRSRVASGTPPTAVAASPTVAEPETIDAFEIGARGQWLDDRLQLGGALFYYSYKDYQVFVIENQFGSAPLLKIINANDARVYGAEADLRASR